MISIMHAKYINNLSSFKVFMYILKAKHVPVLYFVIRMSSCLPFVLTVSLYALCALAPTDDVP